mmetsp:Transcript_68570/g.155090  ORF Transcript_68570/g.155090 Transcript_68570/m.155090 type:complete len:245 (-) Transcript_68570:619-1353(-)
MSSSKTSTGHSALPSEARGWRSSRAAGRSRRGGCPKPRWTGRRPRRSANATRTKSSPRANTRSRTRVSSTACSSARPRSKTSQRRPWRRSRSPQPCAPPRPPWASGWWCLAPSPWLVGQRGCPSTWGATGMRNRPWPRTSSGASRPTATITRRWSRRRSPSIWPGFPTRKSPPSLWAPASLQVGRCSTAPSPTSGLCALRSPGSRRRTAWPPRRVSRPRSTKPTRSTPKLPPPPPGPPGQVRGV